MTTTTAMTIDRYSPSILPTTRLSLSTPQLPCPGVFWWGEQMEQETRKVFFSLSCNGTTSGGDHVSFGGTAKSVSAGVDARAHGHQREGAKADDGNDNKIRFSANFGRKEAWTSNPEPTLRMQGTTNPKTQARDSGVLQILLPTKCLVGGPCDAPCSVTKLLNSHGKEFRIALSNCGIKLHPSRNKASVRSARLHTIPSIPRSVLG